MDLLFNSPRLRFSRVQQKAMLTWARELGASVPNYNQYRQAHALISEQVRKPPQRQATGDGNIWYLNEIGDMIAKGHVIQAYIQLNSGGCPME